MTTNPQYISTTNIEIDDPVERANMIEREAEAHIRKGNMGKALPLLLEAIQIKEDFLHARHLCTYEFVPLCKSLGLVYQSMQEYSKAATYFYRSWSTCCEWRGEESQESQEIYALWHSATSSRFIELTLAIVARDRPVAAPAA